MSEQIVVPVLGESITEATVAKWLKNVGDTVEADEPVVELETDKVNLEVPSPVSGTVGDIKFKDGDVVEVGAVLGSIQTNGQPIKNQTEEKKSEPKIEEENNVISLKKEKNQIEKTEEETIPKVFEEENEEQPLVLINEVAEKEKEKK
jgi:2-oxoglutarate dehydrogenase E2 component (dihydrolipoamide succinyltransferase)